MQQARNVDAKTPYCRPGFVWLAGACKGKVVKIRKMAAHNGLAFGKDNGQKLHLIQEAANKRKKQQHKTKTQSLHKKRKRSASMDKS